MISSLLFFYIITIVFDIIIIVFDIITIVFYIITIDLDIITIVLQNPLQAYKNMNLPLEWYFTLFWCKLCDYEICADVLFNPI